jgi:hypothetical protein
MHFWGDEWFKKNGDDLCNAIDFIEKYLRKHRIGICGKEKYGCYRDDFLNFWDGGLYTILFGHSCYIGTHNNYKWKWLKEFVNKIHHFIYYKLDLGLVTSYQKGEPYEDYCKRIEKRFWKGFQHYSQKIGLLKLVQDHQAKHYNKAFQLACKKWPNVKDELIVMVDGYKMIKPCKWGDVDGEEIHNKYWKKL